MEQGPAVALKVVSQIISLIRNKQERNPEVMAKDPRRIRVQVKDNHRAMRGGLRMESPASP